MATKWHSADRVNPHDPAMNNHDRLLTANELADFLDVPIKTLYAWRYRGEGPVGFRAGKHLRYRWVDVEVWIEDRIAHTCHPRVAQSP
jgi:predicted DNA-binding transcriptional regulator AlpA